MDNEVQPLNIFFPNCKSDEAVRIVTVVNAVQLRTASVPMAFIDSGNSIDGKIIHFSNDLSPIPTTVCGIGILIIAVHPLKQDFGILSKFGGNVADENSVHQLKALILISTIVPVVDGSKTTLVIGYSHQLKQIAPTNKTFLGINPT